MIPDVAGDWWEIVLRLGSASLFGLVLGVDRELRGHAAGMRTHMLVALGAAVVTTVALELHADVLAENPDTTADPLRAIEGVAAAVGFLGGGAILRGRGDVQGLTTAANVWLCGCIGLACGGGYYVLAAIAFGFTFVILTLIHVVERRWVQPHAIDDQDD